MATKELTKDNFNETITNNDFVILDFWAPWCGPCKSFGPTFEKVSEEHDDIVFGKINTEDERELGGYFNIRSIPTLMIMREQVVVFSQPGAMPESGLKDVIQKARDLDMAEVHASVKKQQESAAASAS